MSQRNEFSIFDQEPDEIKFEFNTEGFLEPTANFLDEPIFTPEVQNNTYSASSIDAGLAAELMPVFIHEENPVTDFNLARSNKNSYLIDQINYVKSIVKVSVEGKSVTFDALKKRHYVYADTGEKVSRADMSDAVVYNEKVYLDSRELRWLPKRAEVKRSHKIAVGDKEITLSGFYRRHYIFSDTGESVTNAEKRKSELVADKLYVDGREIIHVPRQLKRKFEKIVEDEKSDVLSEVNNLSQNAKLPFYLDAPRDMLLFQRNEEFAESEMNDWKFVLDDRSKKQHL